MHYRRTISYGRNHYSIQCLRAFDSAIDKVTCAITCRRWYHLERRYIRFPGTHNRDPDVPLNRMQIPGEQWNANDRIDVREKSVLVECWNASWMWQPILRIYQQEPKNIRDKN